MALALLGLIYYLTYFRPVAYIIFATEDSWSEYGTFVRWMAACGLLLRGLSRTPAMHNPGMILFALAAFVIAMEEISWGRRIFGFETPVDFKGANLQSDFTLHNLMSSSVSDKLMNAGILIFAVALPAIAVISRHVR